MVTIIWFNKCLILCIAVLLLSPQLLCTGIPSTCKKPGNVVLSFDQGPGITTGRVLDVLARRNLPALIHVNTDNFQNATWRSYVQRAAFEGHSIGIFLPDLGGSEVIHDFGAADAEIALSERIAKAINWISAITGRAPRHIRFGRKNIPAAMKRVAESMGLQVTKPKIEIRDESNKLDVLWSSINKAFNSSNPEINSFIIKMHDFMPSMAASLDKFVEYIENRGFTIVPIETCQPLSDRIFTFKSEKVTSVTPTWQKNTANGLSQTMTSGYSWSFLIALLLVL